MQMKKHEWRCYQHAAIPNTYPHEQVDTADVENGVVWNLPGRPLLCRWTSDFDCKEQTGCWACIKDTPLDLSFLSAKRRYEINKGNRYYTTRKLVCRDVVDMYDVYVESLQGYSEKILPQEKTKFIREWNCIMSEPETVLIGVFEKETELMCGFAHLCNRGRYIPISSFKTRVSHEKKNVNFALMYGICRFFEEELQQGSYLCDGWRNIRHRTAFQDFLEKYFLFRKAYCRLHIRYNPKIAWCIKLAYPFRCLFYKMDSIKLMHEVNGVLRMEEIARGNVSDG